MNKKTKAKDKAPQATKGPEPARLKIEGDWVAAIDRALKVKRPARGWPK